MKYTLWILLLISGCKSETTSENTEGIKSDSSHEPVSELYEPIDDGSANEVTVGSEIFQFENDEIGAYPFEEDFDRMVVSLKGAEIHKKPVQNLHDSTRTDTLVTVSFGPSVIEYYKVQADGSGFILETSIQSDDVKFKKGIRIGMSRTEFFSLFEELEGKPDLKSVLISTMEGLSQSEFVFVNDTLSTVRYQSYFD